MRLLKTKSGLLRGPKTTRTTTKTIKRVICRMPPIISKASRSFRNHTLNTNGMIIVAIMIRLVCQRSGTYDSLLKIARDVMILARMEGGPAQVKHHAVVVIHPRKY